MPRKTYTREFKLQAVRMITDQGLSVRGPLKKAAAYFASPPS